MSESYSVRAILSAQDDGFTRMFSSAMGSVTKLETKLTGGLGFGVMAGIGQRAFDKVTGAVAGFTNELSGTSKAWQTFTKNLEMDGKTEGEINGIKKELQDFATQTIYSASDMSQTFAQLNAVGIKSAENLVKGFGGLASAAENPKQAMKTLSQQGVQMAARPKVAWQDFKLMLEQTPAGIAAIAKEMGYTTAEMVAAVQAGEIATTDFFEAIEKVGTSDAFTEMATKYKTVDQAMDGLSETITNAALPVFEKFQSVGIKAVEAVIDAVGNIDGEAIAAKISPMLDLVVIHAKRAKKTIDITWGELKKTLDESGIKLPDLNAEGLKSILDDVSRKFRLANKWIRAHSKEVAGLVRALPALAGAFAALKVGQTIVPGFKEFGSALGSFAGIFGQTVSKTTDMGGKMVGFFKGPFGKIGGLVQTGAAKIGGGMAGLFSKIIPPDSVAALIKTKLPGILAPFGQLGSGLAGTVANASGLFVSGLTKMMGMALQVLAPGVLVGAVLVGLGLVYNAFRDQIDETIALIQTNGPQIITSFINGITSKIPGLVEAGATLVGKLLDTITILAPSLINGGINLIAALAGGVASAAPTLIPKAVLLVGTLITGIVSNIPRIIAIGMQLLAGIAQGVGNSMPLIVQQAGSAIKGFINGVVQYGPTILHYGAEILKSLVLGIINSLPYIVEGAKEAGKWFIDTIKNTDWIQLGKDIINGIVDGVKGGFTFIKDAIGEAFSGGGAEEAGAAAVDQAANAVSSNSSTLTTAFSGAGEEGGLALSDSLANLTVDMTPMADSAAGSFTDAFSMSMGTLPGTTDEVFGAVTETIGNAETTINDSGTAITTSTKTAAANTESIVKKTTNSILRILTAGRTRAVTEGDMTGSGYANAISSKFGAASSAGYDLKNAALNALSGGYGTAYYYGQMIGQGLVNGLWSKVSEARTAARQLAAAADEAIAARAKIGSPSKITIAYGKWIAEGLAIGIKDKTYGVVKQAQSTVNAVMARMKAAKTKLANVGNIAGAYTEALKKSVKAKMEKNLSYVESIFKRIKKSADEVFEKDRKSLTAYKDGISAVWNQYKKAYQNEVNSVISGVSSKLTALARTYQSKYEELKNARNNLKDVLRTHDLFATDDYGNVQLTNFSQQLRGVKEFQANINKLKKLLPNGFVEEIIGLGVTDGLAYTKELLKKSTAEIKKYGKQYSTYMGAAGGMSTKYYAGQFKQLEKDYAAQITTMSKTLTKQIKTLGQNIIAGMIDGMNTQLPSLNNTAIDMVTSMVKTIKQKLGIHSPSKVAENITEMFGVGLINGLDNMLPAVRGAFADIMSVPTPELAMPGGGRMSLNEAYDYNTEAAYVIYVESTLDGRKVGEGTAKYVKKSNDNADRRSARKAGKNV